MSEPLLDPASPEGRADAARQAALREAGAIPKHVAVIMDGNGRWAKQRGHHRVVGHHEGVVSVRDVTEAAAELGIEVLTLYTFSTENWQRPKEEVEGLMQLLVDTVAAQRETLLRNGVRLELLGDLDALPDASRVALDALCDETAALSRMTLVLALSYSGRWEIVEAARRVAQDVQAGRLLPDAVTEETFRERLPSGHLPDPDLLIRTGGDVRVSNFLLWGIAYTEIVVTETLWPDFRRAALYDAIAEFQGRERRFGRVLDSASPSAQ